MISREEVIEIIKRPESSILDFKQNFYDFENDNDKKNTAKFIKDVISFSNTIRIETGLILFGIEEKPDKTLKLIGLDTSFDDAMLQEKVKNKVFPRPVFSYYEIIYQNKKIGLMEFPITKYELPITPAIKLKGLEVGKVYYRNGTSNTEANGIDVIRINEWLKSLPGNLNLSLTDKISEILKRLYLNQEQLSLIIVDLLSISKIYKLNVLETFCSAQITGIGRDEAENHIYRIQKVFVSLKSIEINPNSVLPATGDLVEKEMGKNDKFDQYQILFSQSILKIEELINGLNDGKNFFSMKISSKKMFNKGDYDMNVFLFKSNLIGIYNAIRQKLIDEIIKI